MTESYTELQETYLGKITTLSNEISNQRDQIRAKQLLLMKRRQDRDQMILDRDNEIDTCKREIDKASSDFASDLKAGLLKLQERFDFAGTSQGHDGNEVLMMKKLDDIVAHTMM